MKKDLLKMLRQFQNLKSEKESLKLRATLLEKQIQELMPQLVTGFEAEKMQSINLTGVGTFYLEAQTFPKVEDNDTLIAWMKRNKMRDLVKTTVNYQTLRGLVNERLKNNLSIPEGIVTYNEVVVKMRSSEK